MEQGKPNNFCTNGRICCLRTTRSFGPTEFVVQGAQPFSQNQEDYFPTNVHRDGHDSYFTYTIYEPLFFPGKSRQTWPIHDGNLFIGSFANSFPLQFNIFLISRHPRGMGYKIYSVWRVTLGS